MFALLTLFLSHSASAICPNASGSGSNYQTGQIFNGATILRDCSFEALSGQGSGPALRLMGGYDFGISGCCFATWHTTSQPGGIYTQGCRSFAMNDTSAWACQAGGSYGFCVVRVEGLPDVEPLGAHRCSIGSCSCEEDTAAFGLSSTSDDTSRRTSIESLNSSLNKATNGGSGLVTTRNPRLVMRFCAFSGNTQGAVWCLKRTQSSRTAWSRSPSRAGVSQTIRAARARAAGGSFASA
jgi:hypothetical protein